MRFFPAMLTALLAVGCAAPSTARHHLARIFRSASTQPVPLATLARPDASPAAMIERSLHQRGLRFGTDGSVGALYAYLANREDPIAPEQARPGDVIFFDLRSDGGGCGNHVGLVERRDANGRITFREWRAGSQRQSYVHPRHPRARRDESGRVLNTFLRIKQPDDPADALYFAGEMLCAVFRP
jgi:hypothetical protein